VTHLAHESGKTSVEALFFVSSTRAPKKPPALTAQVAFCVAKGGEIWYTMLGAFISTELAGGANEGVRRHAKAALTLVNELQHNRTATYRQAALCGEALTAVVNLLAIVSGRRDRDRSRLEA